jgi:hypothetical protein
VAFARAGKPPQNRILGLFKPVPAPNTLCFRRRLDPAELRRNGDVAKRNGNPLRLDILVPVFMSCALLWWVSRGMSWLARLVVTAITLATIICIVLFERAGLF